MYSHHPLVDVHKLGHRPPLLILYRTLYPCPRPPSPAPLFSKNHTRPLQPLTTSRNFQFFRVPRESGLPPGCNVEARATTFRSIDLRRNFTSTWAIPGCEIGRYVTPLMSNAGTGSRAGRTQREFEEDGIEREIKLFFFSKESFFRILLRYDFSLSVREIYRIHLPR